MKSKQIKKWINPKYQPLMKYGTIEIILLALIFLSLQFWWIRMTIKNGRTGEVDKWGQKSSSKQLNELDQAKEELEKLFRSQFKS